MNEQLTMTIDEASRLSGISRARLYEDVHKGQLKGRKVGRYIRVLRGDLDTYLAALPVVGDDDD